MTEAELVALNAEVGEKVMGWHQGPQKATWYKADGGTVADMFWSPATDISAAWEVVEKIGPDFSLAHFVEGDWQAQFSRGERVVEASAGTAPLAICLAAIKAMA